MTKKVVWLLVSCLMVVSLVMASCGPAAEEEEEEEEEEVIIGEEEEEEEEEEKETVSPDMPRYGGVLKLGTARDVMTFDNLDRMGGGITLDLTNQRLWDGDWARGPAGGYGTGETDWASSYDVHEYERGYLAESMSFEIDNESDGRIVFNMRKGIKFAYNPDSPASRLVNGREINVDDVVFSLNRLISDPQSNIYRASKEMRELKIEKTGADQVTIYVPVSILLMTMKRMNDSSFPYPKEVIETFGDMRDWRNSVGTGPFILKDYVVASAAKLVRNPDYWMTDPVGPGKGNQLPYADAVTWLIIPDASTRMAALRTGKIDQLYDMAFEDALQMEKMTPELKKAPQDLVSVSPIYMRTDKKDMPYSDIRARRAMMMAIDFKTIERDLYYDTGDIISWPYYYNKPYAPLYLGLDDPDCPDSVKELYSYNPDKAKQLLAEAGYPNGFKTELILQAPEVDYYSIIKDYWDDVGIDLQLDVMEAGVHFNINQGRTHEHMITSATGPPSIWPILSVLEGEAWTNCSYINDPKVNETEPEIGRLAITDELAAMKLTRELMKYVLDQAWVIPSPNYPRYTMWWPWLKNYSGERSIGYFWVLSWPQYVWLDEDLRESMGH
jgi:peptide/nickel transport system substrate-binding protein